MGYLVIGLGPTGRVMAIGLMHTQFVIARSKARSLINLAISLRERRSLRDEIATLRSQ